MGDKNPIRTLGNYSKPSHEGYKNTILAPYKEQHGKERSCVYFNYPFAIKLAIGLNVFQQDPSPHGRILLLVSLRNSFHREGQQNSVMPSLCSNNIKSLSKSWTRFKDLLHKVPHHGIDHWLIIQIFYDHVSFYPKCEIDHSDCDKLRDKNADEYLEIIENLTLYDLERWNDSKGFVKPVKAISTSQGTSKTPDQRLLDLEDQINFLLKGLRPTFKPSSTHVPQAYVEAVSSTPYPQT
nr:MAK10-like protein [Tanacetum cinerariifolium]